MMIGHNLWLCTISANIYLGKTTFRSSGSKWYLFLPEIFAQRPICLYFQLWSVTSPRQMQTAAPVLVDTWQIADKYPLCLASFRLHLQIQKAFRKKKSNKPMRSLFVSAQTKLFHWICLSCGVSTFHWSGWLYTQTFNDDTDRSTWEHFRKSNTQHYFFTPCQQEAPSLILLNCFKNNYG